MIDSSTVDVQCKFWQEAAILLLQLVHAALAACEDTAQPPQQQAGTAHPYKSSSVSAVLLLFHPSKNNSL
jgi:hypothetical protein